MWPWLVAGLVALAALAAFARAAPRRRPELAAAVAGVAAAAALAATTAFATGDAIARRAQWIEVGSAALLAVLAAAALLLGDRSLRTWAAMVVGVVAAALGLGSLSVFWHGVVISSLPASLARLATAVAFLGGAAAVVLAVLTPTRGAPEMKSRLACLVGCVAVACGLRLGLVDAEGRRRSRPRARSSSRTSSRPERCSPASR